MQRARLCARHTKALRGDFLREYGIHYTDMALMPWPDVWDYAEGLSTKSRFLTSLRYERQEGEFEPTDDSGATVKGAREAKRRARKQTPEQRLAELRRLSSGNVVVGGNS